VSKVKNICTETSASESIKRLKENADIASWVESGVDIHSLHSSEICEYCLQKIPEERLLSLANHFNDSDKLLKNKLEFIINEGQAIKSGVQPNNFPGSHQLYDEFHSPFQIASLEFKVKKEQLLNLIEEYLELLETKLTSRTEAIGFDLDEIDLENFNNSIQGINHILREHSQKTRNFEGSIAEARSNIESHHLSLIKEEVDGFDSEILEKNERLKIINEGDKEENIGIDELKNSIVENKAKVANLQIACDKLNELLYTFLGRSDLRFEPDEAGYRILRNNKSAKRLSEGEKTAITFIYFIVQLNDQDFELDQGIVVIDDPISSLDSNSLYQAFSFLKNSVKDAHQIFLFTHNFDFLKLLLNWMQKIPKKEGKRSYYMLLCGFGEDGSRNANICPMDKELLKNKSEYAFLFKQLYNFRSDGTILGSYHIPNIARKVLETFLDFYYPESETMYKKMGKVDFDDNKKTAIMKFSNDFSHPTGKGFDPALVPETQKNVRYLLDMIEAVSPIHFESLKNSIEVVA
jgi:wobble nucleotide-excising tRNase